MTWNAEAEAKVSPFVPMPYLNPQSLPLQLFLGVLDQVRGAKLDYKALAAFMGPGMISPSALIMTFIDQNRLLGCCLAAEDL
jgi:hypothetical protein